MSPDLLSVTVRAAAFVCLFQAAGAAFFLARSRGLTRSLAPIARLGCGAAVAGALLILCHQSLEAARMAGEYTGLVDPDLQRLAWLSAAGLAHILQACGMLLIVTALGGARRPAGFRSIPLAVAGAMLAVLAFLLAGHTSAHALRVWLAPLLALHLLIIAFWFGALAPLALVLRREPLAIAARSFEAFSVVAVWLVPLILVAGFGLAIIMASGLAVLRQPYGQLLALKLAGYAMLMGFAFLNRSRLAPALETHGADAAPALRKSLAIEYALLASVLAVTAVLTTFYSPDH